jgi:hypothetical protein
MAGDPRPPEPNPANPVNYIEWINETFGIRAEENAAQLYAEAFDRLDVQQVDWGSTTDAPWSNEENQDVARWLGANAAALKQFRRAAAKGECFFLFETPMETGNLRVDSLFLRVEFPHLRAQRETVKALIADGYRAWREGDQDRLTENALIALQSAHHRDGAATLIERLVGASCALFGYKALRNATHLCNDPARLAGSILPRLAAADPSFPSLARAYLGERILCWDLCQRLYTTAEGTGAWTVYKPLLAELDRLGLPGLHGGLGLDSFGEAGYGRILAEYDAYYDALEEWSRTPYYIAAKQTERLEELTNSSRNRLLKSLASVHHSRSLFEGAATERRATHLILHLFAYWGKKGRFPRALSQLEAPDLDELRGDSFSGRDLIYKRKGKDFTLYSIGENLTDDGGQPGEGRTDGDFVYWPISK